MHPNRGYSSDHHGRREFQAREGKRVCSTLTGSMPEPTVVRIATRESPLALAQTRLVADAIAAKNPGVRVELVPMTTRGDRVVDRPLAQVGGKGLFVKELEAAMAEGRADLAVHS